jgi:hypothetical protein
MGTLCTEVLQYNMPLVLLVAKAHTVGKGCTLLSEKR